MGAETLSHEDYPTTATIKDGQTTSAAVNLSAASCYGVAIPSGFEGTSLKFLVADGKFGTYQELQGASGALSLTVAAGKSYTLPAELGPWGWVKFVSSAAASGADRVITVVRKR